MARISLSSTLEDLIHYRKAVLTVLGQMRHKVISTEDYPAAKG